MIDLEGLTQIENDGQEIGRDVQKWTPKGWGFCVVFFEFGEGREGATMVTSCDPSALPHALREAANSIETGGMRPPGVLGREN